jgi:hypothetical protein
MQVAFAQDEQVVQALTPDTAQEPFHNRVGQWRPHWC